ncbi:Mg2+ and Co2+ transporter CorA [Natronospira proteinivora]|uniref:Mg2+ and Co2+ transporter CorA n=1 Tax=Natronospira proteinivora TaxID=1807133 RepID=A0ABT1G933_9GAMM|nr:antibiotic biosynthesis monooxygenase [Natronospira proteinivora]MCP1727835.1 Mg2+ and Co2+ transporter CorA [Natronospira proteinivora]
MNEANFVILYRWRIKPEQEEHFARHWSALMALYQQLFGAVGGRLHQREDGLWIAYAEWPSREQYFLAIERGIPDESIADAMNEAVRERLEPEFMEVRRDVAPQ